MSPPNPETPRGDVTLADLLAGLWRRRWLISAIVVLVGGGGSVFAWQQKPIYEYTTLIQIAKTVERDAQLDFGAGELRLSSGESRPVEPPSTVARKIREGFSPRIKAQMAEAGAAEVKSLEMDVAQTGEDLVTIISKAPKNQAALQETIHAKVVARVRENHADLIAAERSRLKSRRGTAEAALQRARSNEGTEIDDGIQGRIAEYKARLEALEGTHAVVVAQQSDEPLGDGPAPMAGLAWLVGLVLGVVGGGIVELVSRARVMSRAG